MIVLDDALNFMYTPNLHFFVHPRVKDYTVTIQARTTSATSRSGAGKKA